MATVTTTPIRAFVSGETVTPAKLNELSTPTISVSSIVNADIDAAAAIAFSKLAQLDSANILVGNSSNVATKVAVTGDVTISNSGVTSIGSSKVTPTMLSQPLTISASVATTSGTAIDFTGIPSWAKRITVMLNGVSTNGASPIEIRVGSGSIASSGYESRGSYIENANFCYTGASTSGFKIDKLTDAGELRVVTATLVNISGTTWLFASIGANINGAGQTLTGGGNVTLSGALDRIRLTTVNGTDTFDAGSANIMYEG
jgi:hypothetical protein